MRPRGLPSVSEAELPRAILGEFIIIQSYRHQLVSILASTILLMACAVYSAGPIDAINQGDETVHAFIILERGTPEDVLWEFTHWIDQQSEPELAAIPRTGSETYIP